jgi:hypothetical protein
VKYILYDEPSIDVILSRVNPVPHGVNVVVELVVVEVVVGRTFDTHTVLTYTQSDESGHDTISVLEGNLFNTLDKSVFCLN